MATSYGIKEVADVRFYAIEEDGSKGALKYSFDSLKVSNIELASENTSAKGGKGNPELINWSYGKEITFTIEDALISMETLHLLFGGTKNNDVVTVDAETFPECYWIEGVTYARSAENGKDSLLKFTIFKGQVQANATITMEAEGDPSTFEMTIKALRNSEKNLIKFEKGVDKEYYGEASMTTGDGAASAELKSAIASNATISYIAGDSSKFSAAVASDGLSIDFSKIGDAALVENDFCQVAAISAEKVVAEAMVVVK